MPTIKAHTIALIWDGRYEEGRADGVVIPGMLVAPDTQGNYVPFTTAGGKTGPVFACEDALQGKTIDDNYASGDLMQLAVMDQGDVVNAWLAAGQAVTPADFLSSDGTGRFKKWSGSDTRLAQPLESLDLTASGSGHTRIRARLV